MSLEKIQPQHDAEISSFLQFVSKCHALLATYQDCSAALQLNPDLGKAYRIRGVANRKLGKYKEAKSDLAQAWFSDSFKMSYIIFIINHYKIYK